MATSKDTAISSTAETESGAPKKDQVVDAITAANTSRVLEAASNLRSAMLEALNSSSTSGQQKLGTKNIQSLSLGRVSVSDDKLTADLPNGGTLTVDGGGFHISGGGGASTIPGIPGFDLPNSSDVNIPNPTSGANSSAGGIPIPWPQFVPTPITIPIPTPQFTAMPVSVPLPTPQFLPTSFSIPFPTPDFTALPVHLFPMVAALLSAGKDCLGLGEPFMTAFANKDWNGMWAVLNSQGSATTGGSLLEPILSAVENRDWQGLLAALDSAKKWKDLLGFAEKMKSIGKMRVRQIAQIAVGKVTSVTQDAHDPAPLVREVQAAIAATVDEWAAAARVGGGSLNYGVALVPPGGLQSNVDFKATLEARMKDKTVPVAIARPVAEVLAHAWERYFSSYLTALWYPEALCFPAPQMPPMPNLPMNVSMGLGDRNEMSGPAIEHGLITALGSAASNPDIVRAVSQISRWFVTRFNLWCDTYGIVDVMGGGPVPTSILPFAVVGPVINGTVSSGTLAPLVPTSANVFQVPYLDA